MNNRSHSPTIAACILALAIISCGGSTSATPQNGVGTIVAATMSALTSLAPQSPLIVQPSPMPSPTTAPTVASNSVPIAVNFQTGATGDSISGSINPGQVIAYSLRVAQGQPGRIILGASNNDVTLSIQGQDGSELLPAAAKTSSWQSYFPKSQVYVIKLYGGAAPSNFDLSVNVSARVTFAPGADHTVLKGKTAGGYIVSYALNAQKGQTLTMTINTAPEVAALTVWGFIDGQPYARAQNGITNFSMQLPSTQDYIIDVVPQGGSVVDYVLTITVK